MGIHITWLGHSGFALKVNGAHVLIDPFLTGNPLAPVEPEQLEADFILLTHAHADHVGDTVAIAKRTGAMVIGVWEVHAWMQNHGVVHTHAQNVGGGYAHPFGHVKFVRADHSSSFPDGSYGGTACGIVLTVDGTRLYFAGDTALFSDMRLVGELGIEFAALPIGDNFTMGPSESVEATKLIRPRSVFPVHYNTFPAIQQDAAGWAQSIHTQTDARAIIVDPGGSFSV